MTKTEEIEDAPITATVIPHQRWVTRPPAIWTRLTRRVYLPPFDIAVMEMFDWLCPAGSHATRWQLHTTSNGSLFLSPRSSEKTHHFDCKTNRHQADLSSEAGGIVATIFALHVVKDHVDDETLGQVWRGLMHYIYQHPEGGAILYILD